MWAQASCPSPPSALLSVVTSVGLIPKAINPAIAIKLPTHSPRNSLGSSTAIAVAVTKPVIVPPSSSRNNATANAGMLGAIGKSAKGIDKPAASQSDADDLLADLGL